MLQSAADSSTGPVTSVWPFLIFGAMAMAGLAVLQYLRFRNAPKRRFSLAFLKTYGLVLVATLGTVLVFVPGDAESRTGAFTLLGIIAGYLATTPGGDPVKDPIGHTPEPAPGAGGAAGGAT